MRILTLLLVLFTLNIQAQQTITLEKCYELVAKNYPLAKQTDLLNAKLTIDKASITKEKLPKIFVNAQATYQSDVIQLPIKLPNTTIEPLNKDQYRATLDANQLIYNGGLIDAQTKLKEIQAQTQKQQTEVSLYLLKNKINHYYFSILFLQEKARVLQSKKDFLTEKIKEVKSAVKYGAILPSSEQVIAVELLKIEQQMTDIQFEKSKMLQNLATLTYTKFEEATQFVQPEIKEITTQNSRPELALFDYQNQQMDALKSIVSKTNYPKITAFAQGGYGNPGLNMLDNSFQPFYMTGVKVNWNIFDWNKAKKDQQSLEISKEIIATEKETFELNTALQTSEWTAEIEKLEQIISTDESIVELREKIQKSADAQMRNGVITTAEYLNEVTQLFESKIAQKTHEIQLQLAKSTHQISKGN